MIKIATNEDLKDLLIKFAPMELSENVVTGLLCVDQIVHITENNNVIGSIACPISFNDCGTVGKVIGIWLADSKYKEKVLFVIQDMIGQVLYSPLCTVYLGYKPEYMWQEIVCTETKIKTNTYIDSSIFHYKFNQIRSSALDIATELEEVDKTRNSFLTDSMKDGYNKMYVKGLEKVYEGVYTFPFLSKSFCKKLIKKVHKYEYVTNKQEDTLYQMPEIVLYEKDIELHKQLVEIYHESIDPIAKSMYGVCADDIRSIQLAKYSAEGISGGNWHYDQDSDITIVVSLSDDYEGGGTMIKPYGDAEEIMIPKLPIGHAVLFRGRHFLHKGLQVTKGDRDILVFWTMAEEV